MSGRRRPSRTSAGVAAPFRPGRSRRIARAQVEGSGDALRWVAAGIDPDVVEGGVARDGREAVQDLAGLVVVMKPASSQGQVGAFEGRTAIRFGRRRC